MQALQRGDLPAAETAFNKVCPSSSSAEATTRWLGVAGERKNRTAIREFQAAIKLKPISRRRTSTYQRFSAEWKSRRALREAKEAVRLARPTPRLAHTFTRVRRIW